jgi:hypothetical protein
LLQTGEARRTKAQSFVASMGGTVDSLTLPDKIFCPAVPVSYPAMRE